MYSSYRLYGFRISKIEFIANHVSDYHTFLLTDKNPKLIELIIEYVRRRPNWDLIEFQDVPEDSETAQMLTKMSAKLGVNQRIQEPVFTCLCQVSSRPFSRN